MKSMPINILTLIAHKQVIVVNDSDNLGKNYFDEERLELIVLVTFSSLGQK